MFAIRAHRHAAGERVGGQDFEHQRWTLVEELTPELEAAALPEQGRIQPRLCLLEVSDADDPKLAGLGVVGQEASLVDGAGDDLDLEHTPLPGLKKIAKLLNIPRSQGRAELIASIHAKQAEIEGQAQGEVDAPAGDERQGEAGTDTESSRAEITQ